MAKVNGGRKAKLPPRTVTLFEQCYAATVERLAFVAFIRLAEIGVHFDLLALADAAADAEKVAAGGTDHAYAMAVRGVWEFGAALYERIGDDAGRQRCKKGALGQILAQRDKAHSPAAAGHMVLEALQAMRGIDGLESQEVELEAELRRLQKAALKDMAPYKIEFDFSDGHRFTEELYANLPFSKAMIQFAFLSDSRSREELRAEALQSLKDFPLSGMFAGVHLDHEGKPIARSAGAGLGDDPPETWFLQKIEQAEHLRRIELNGAYIDKARVLINATRLISAHHFHPIVAQCPFIPPSHGVLMAHGFARYFQGDFMSALHILVPQLEPCLRHILKLNGLDPAKRFDDGTEEDMHLGNLLNFMREPLDQIMDPATVYEIERLFDARPGLRLRHHIAHGQIGAGGCFSHDAGYACWFIYRLCVLFVAEVWDEKIAPALEAEFA
ncbi:hypothetical protein AMEJIAPC_02892 [Caulobacter sp. NIBR1757]|nr:hypothetical protein AMEJIAPC_02892 [Caulobacter sp. NIBR1757]